MLTPRPSAERGGADHGWLKTRHTFSFADYYDEAFMGFRTLRVLNEDRVAPGGGFPPHPHRDMEIVSYVLDGGLEHKDSTGSGSVLRAGEVQRMSAGRGVVHSEFNASKDAPVHFLQIWIVPDSRGLAPGYEQRSFAAELERGGLVCVAKQGGGDGALAIHQDVVIYAARMKSGQSLEHRLAPGRAAWIQVARGVVTANGQRLSAGDGASLLDEAALRLVAQEDAELLLFDLR